MDGLFSSDILSGFTGTKMMFADNLFALEVMTAVAVVGEVIQYVGYFLAHPVRIA